MQESQVSIAETSGAGAAISADLAHTQEQLQAAQARIITLDEEIKEKKQAISTLRGTIVDYGQQIADLTASLDAQATELQKEKTNLTNKLNEKSAAHTKLEQAMESHQRELEEARSERERLTQILDERQRNVTADTEELSSLTERVTQILQQLDSKSKLERLLHERDAELNSERRASAETIAQLNASIEKAVSDLRLRLSPDEAQALRLKVESLTQISEEYAATAERLKKELDINLGRITDLNRGTQGSLAEKNAKLGGLEERNKELRQQLEKLTADFSARAKEIRKLTAAAKTSAAEQEGLTQDNQRLSKELSQLQAQIRESKASHDAREGELAAALTSLREKNIEIARISGEVRSASVQVENAKRDMAKLQQDLQASEERATKLETQNNLLDEQIKLLQQGSVSTEALDRIIAELKKSMQDDQVKLERERNEARSDARKLRDASIQLQRDAESNREELAVKEKQLAEETIERNRFSEQLGTVSEQLRITNNQLEELTGEKTAFQQQMEDLKSRPGFIARKGPLEGFSYSSSSSDEEAYRRRARSQNSFRDALVDDDSPSSSEPVRVSRPESFAPTLASVQWTRPPVRSGAARRREIIDINNFKPDIPAQAEAWKVKLEGVARDINIGDPDRVYRSVEQLLRSTHPSESEFYHRFYTMIGWVEGACAKNKGAFWIAKTEGLQHLTKDVIEAATTKINTIPISEAEFFPLSRDELTTGIARELTVYRRMTTGSGRRVEVAPPAYQLVKSADDYRNTVIRRQQDELNDAAAGFWREGDVAERERASMNQQRYLKRNPEAPLLGFGQRYVESKAVDRLDPGTLTLFNYESALIIPYNFWYFLQEKIISKLNVGHDKYVVELKNMTDHAWTNVPAGHTINDIAHYLADNLWDKLQIRHAKGSTERIPSVLSVKKMLDDLAIKRVTEQMSFIDANYNQAWQDRIVALLQTAVHPNAFNSFITALAKIGYPFDVYDPRLNRVLQNITFANLVGAIYQQNVLSNRAGGVTGRQIVAADSKVSRLIDELSRSLGISTTFAYTPPQTIYGGFARSSSSSSSSSDQSTASIPSFLSI